MVNYLLKLENLAVLAASLYFYSVSNLSWVLFLLLFFTPDISMIGYLRNPKTGAFIYNLFHNYILVLGLIIVGAVTRYQLLVGLGLILSSHISFDRLLGFGLKYPDDFKHTHSS